MDLNKLEEANKLAGSYNKEESKSYELKLDPHHLKNKSIQNTNLTQGLAKKNFSRPGGTHSSHLKTNSTVEVSGNSLFTKSNDLVKKVPLRTLAQAEENQLPQFGNVNRQDKDEINNILNKYDEMNTGRLQKALEANQNNNQASGKKSIKSINGQYQIKQVNKYHSNNFESLRKKASESSDTKDSYDVSGGEYNQTGDGLLTNDKSNRSSRIKSMERKSNINFTRSHLKESSLELVENKENKINDIKDADASDVVDDYENEMKLGCDETMEHNNQVSDVVLCISDMDLGGIDINQGLFSKENENKKVGKPGRYGKYNTQGQANAGAKAATNISLDIDDLDSDGNKKATSREDDLKMKKKLVDDAMERFSELEKDETSKKKTKIIIIVIAVLILIGGLLIILKYEGSL